jgi:glucose/arabinose dehydrogenase
MLLLQLNHGLVLSEDGATLYASTSNDVYSWAYNAQDGTLDSDSRRTLVTNMSNSDHTTRTLLLPRRQPDLIIVSRGSDSNWDPDAEDVDTGHAQLRSFNITSLGTNQDADPHAYEDGDILGWGLRNSVGVAEDPVHGGIWSVENSVDELHRNGEDIHQDNPAEELNFHGYLNGSDAGLPDLGGNYGYPQCFAIWSTDNFPDLGDMDTGSQFPGAETTTLTDETCNDDYIAPYLSFQAHTAPLDIKFTEDGSEAFISFHGSWNRDDPVGYKVASIEFSSDGRPSADRTSRDASTDILSTPDLSKCPDNCFRPAGLAWDAQGRLWVSSDSTGQIFVLERTSSSGGDDNGDGGSDGSSDDQDDAAMKLMHSKASLVLGAVVVGFFLL